MQLQEEYSFHHLWLHFIASMFGHSNLHDVTVITPPSSFQLWIWFLSGRNYRSYRESQISIPASVAAQAASGLSQAGDITDMQSRIGGSRMSRMTGGLAPDEEELFEYYDDR